MGKRAGTIVVLLGIAVAAYGVYLWAEAAAAFGASLHVLMVEGKGLWGVFFMVLAIPIWLLSAVAFGFPWGGENGEGGKGQDSVRDSFKETLVSF